jgi:hypothetical protein
MLRSITVAGLVLGGMAHGAIFPDQIGAYKKGPPKTIAVPDQALYDEYGLEATEQAEYVSPEKRFTATTWRMRDSTGAMALFEARRPPGATSAGLTKLSVRTSDGVIFAYGNYVFQFTGGVPAPADLEPLYGRLPRLEQSALPALMTYLPANGLVPNSERYIVGPVSLERFEPRIPPSMAAFRFGSEAQIGTYRSAKGVLKLAIFSYPTPGIARERYQEFQNLPGAMVKREGALVAIMVAPPDPDAAERVLAQVKYETNVTWNQAVPKDPVKGVAKLVLDIFMFTGMLLGLCVLAGIGFGGVRILARRLRHGEEAGALITLHLSDK